jgi:uncharacterized protein (TIGR02466 family)
MEIKPIFSSVIAIDNIQVDNTVLENYCRQQISQFEQEKNTTISQSTFLNLQDIELQPLLDIVSTKINMLHKDLGFVDNHRQQIIRGWANINNSEGVDFLHSHPGAFFNAIYYVKADDESAGLMLLSPIPNLDHLIQKELIQHWNAFNSTWQMIKPYTGMLVIMPAWLKHYVKKHDSTTDRISMAFDSVMVKK